MLRKVSSRNNVHRDPQDRDVGREGGGDTWKIYATVSSAVTWGRTTIRTRRVKGASMIGVASVLILSLTLLYITRRSSVVNPQWRSDVKIDSIVNGPRLHAIWSRGWKHLVECDAIPDEYYRAGTEERLDETLLASYFSSCGGLIWVRLSDVGGFIKKALPLMTRKFTLVTSDGDASLYQGHMGGLPSALPPSLSWTLLSNPLLSRWYTQNYDCTIEHSKIFLIPIGFDLHTYRDLGGEVGGGRGMGTMRLARERIEGIEGREKVVKSEMRLGGKCEAEKEKCRIEHSHLVDWAACKEEGRKDCRADSLYVNFNWRGHSRHAFKERREAMVKVGLARGGNCDLSVVYDEGVNTGQVWERYGTFRFGMSPHGNGLDAHRTWEMLYFGMIPVVKTSSLDPLYEGLPVVIVRDWSEMCGIDLVALGESLKPRWEQVNRKDFFTSEYWLQRAIGGGKEFAQGAAVDTASQPEVYLMTLPREQGSAYLARTRMALDALGWTWYDYDSIDGRTQEGAARIEDVARRWDINLSLRDNVSQPGALVSVGAQGLWATKLSVWTKGFEEGKPVITLEGDTEPLREWSGLPEGWRQYDFLFLHSHEHAKKSCDWSGIKEGLDYWYATGSLLFTSQNPARFEAAIRGTAILLNDDWWLNDMHKNKRLKVGQLCRYYFRQHIDHPSTVRSKEE